MFTCAGCFFKRFRGMNEQSQCRATTHTLGSVQRMWRPLVLMPVLWRDSFWALREKKVVKGCAYLVTTKLKSSWARGGGVLRADCQRIQVFLHHVSLSLQICARRGRRRSFHEWKTLNMASILRRSSCSAAEWQRSAEEAPFSELTPLIWISKHDVKRWLKANYSLCQWKVN